MMAWALADIVVGADGTHRPPHIIPRSHRFNPIVAPTTRGSVRAHRRGWSRSNDDRDGDDDDF